LRVEERKGRSSPSSAPWAARLRARSELLWHWFFPAPIELTPPLRRLLGSLYPDLQLERLRLHRGLPHLVRLLGSQAIALPALWAPRRARLYFDPSVWRPDSTEGLGTLAHEAFHALQMQDSGWGIGPLRPFLWLYFACGAANGFRYEGHPLETDAYLLAGRRSSRFEAGLRGRSEAEPYGEVDLARAEILSRSIARTHSEVDFWRRMACSTPILGRLIRSKHEIRSKQEIRSKPARFGAWILASPLILLWLGVWAAAAALVWIVLVSVEVLGLIAAGAIRLLARHL
jgi:hypothetical protein